MAESRGYQPEEGDIVAHRFDERHDDAYFSLGTNYGGGRPHYYVCLDENGGERSWWLDPDSAEELGRRLVESGARCRLANAEADQRSPPPGATV